MGSEISTLQKSISQIEKEWNECVAKQDETQNREKTAREALSLNNGGMRGREQKKVSLEAARSQAQHAAQEAQESAAQLEQQSSEKARMDAYYDKKVEVGRGAWL